MMINTDSYWFQKKWGTYNSKSLEERISALENLVVELQDKIKYLEEENIETSNCLYELSNSIDAVDARIDIIVAEKWIEKNV